MRWLNHEDREESKTTKTFLFVIFDPSCPSSWFRSATLRYGSGIVQSWIVVRAPPLPWRHSEGAPESAMEMTLVGEAQIGGDGGNGSSAAKPPLRFGQLEMHLVGVHRESVGLLELPRQLKSAHRRERREVGQPQMLADVLTQILVHAL